MTITYLHPLIYGENEENAINDSNEMYKFVNISKLINTTPLFLQSAWSPHQE